MKDEEDNVKEMQAHLYSSNWCVAVVERSVTCTAAVLHRQQLEHAAAAAAAALLCSC